MWHFLRLSACDCSIAQYWRRAHWLTIATVSPKMKSSKRMFSLLSPSPLPHQFVQRFPAELRTRETSSNFSPGCIVTHEMCPIYVGLITKLIIRCTVPCNWQHWRRRVLCSRQILASAWSMIDSRNVKPVLGNESEVHQVSELLRVIQSYHQV